MRIYGGAPGTSNSVLATVPVPCSDFSVVLVNVTGSSATARLNLYPQGGGAATANIVLPDVVVAAHSVVAIDLPLELAVGDVFSGLQGTGSAINFFVDVEVKK